MNQAVLEVVGLNDHATKLLFEWIDEVDVGAFVTGDLHALDALTEADLLGFRVGASLGETLHVVDVLASFVADQLSVDCPPLEDKRALVAAFDEADDVARTIVEYHADVLSLDDLTYLEPAVAYGEVLALHEDWPLFQKELELLIVEAKSGAGSSLLDLGCCLFVLDRVGVDRFRGGLFWVRSRVLCRKPPMSE